MHRGWISIWRMLLDKYIWVNSTPEQKVVLVTVLLMANHEAHSWVWKKKDYLVQPGQFITSLNSLVEKCGKGVSIQNVRTALKKFQTHGFLTIQSTNENSLITITNWDDYQKPEPKLTNELTSDQQATNKRLTTNNNDNNENKNTDTKVSLSNAEHSTQDKINYDEVVKFFNSKTKGVFGEVRLPISDKRKKAIRARIREHGKVAFGEVVVRATSSDFLKGSTKFKATFDWIIKPDNFSKILEGNYDNRKNNENNGNNGITAKQQQRHKVAGDVYQDLLSNVFSENDK